MSIVDLGKALERFLRCTDTVIDTFSGPDSAHASEPRRSKATNAYNESLIAMHSVWAQLEDRMQASGIAGKAACARGWLSAHLERNLFLRSELLLATVREQSEIAASNESHHKTRRNATHVVLCAGQTAFLLLTNVCSIICLANHPSSSKTDRDLAAKATAAMTQRGFMRAVADAARGMCALAVCLLGPTGEDDPEAPTDPQQGMFSTAAGSTSLYLVTVVQLLAGQMDTAGLQLTLCTGGAPPTSVIPPEIVEMLDSLAGSELLAAAAALVICSPQINASELCPKSAVDVSVDHMRSATSNIAKAMSCHVLIQSRVGQIGGREGRRLACRLLHATRHVAVRRLQVALLDQLAAHAGMGAELGGGDEGQGQQQQGQGGHQEDGWEGSSGEWWFARHEGQSAGLPECARLSGTAEWLEDHHSLIVCSTLWEWQSADEDLASEAGVEARPPPLLAARLAARAAEALVRLCRGQGLGGAYAPAPLWQLARAPALVLSLLPKPEHVDALPPATVRACLPHWLEAAGWAAALMSDATAAAMGRLPSTDREGGVWTIIDVTLVRVNPQAYTLDQLLSRLRDLARSEANGFKTLPDATQDDVRCRLFRCGMAASLDHTLRLLYSAQTSQTFEEVVKDLDQVCAPMVHILSLRLAPLLPPAPQAAGQPAVGQAGAGSSCRDRKAGGGEAPGDQLGLLYTLSKRAAMLTRALEAMAEQGAGQGQGRGRGQDGGQRESLLEWAGFGLVLLTTAMDNMEEEVRRRLWAASQAAAASGGDDAQIRGGGRSSTGGACADEAHEALALAARAECNLAAAYTWQLADHTAAGGSARLMSDSLQTEDFGPLVMSDVLRHLIEWGRDPPLLSPAQLLACQPHRLLAAACALVAALPAAQTCKRKLGATAMKAVTALSAHPTISGTVRSWLAPPPPAAAAAAGTIGGGGGGEGCLTEPVKLAVRHLVTLAPREAAFGATLLKVAAGEVLKGAAGGRDPAEEVDRSYQHCAAQLAWLVWESLTKPAIMACLVPRLPDGSQTLDHLPKQLDANGRPMPPPPPSAPSGALPPPLALPPGRAGALPRVRMCGNPLCGNFGCEGEWALPLKHCGRCRAVRYCGADCQRAHWREGHKAECKALAAGAIE